MAGNIKGLTVEIDGNVTKLSKAIATVNTDAKKLQRELRGVTTLLEYDPKNVVLLEQKQRKLNEALEDQADKLKELQDLEKAYSEQLGPRTEEEAKDFESLQREIVATSRSLEAAKRALADFRIEQGVAHSAIGKLGEGLESFGRRVKPAGEMIESMGGKLSRTLTPAVLAAGAVTVAAAVDIDTNLTNVRKTVDGTEEQYQALKEAAIEFSLTNAVSASQILDIQALGAQLGFAIDELDEFGQVVSGLDIATNMGAEQAATEMAQFANITKMSRGEIRNYGSAIVGLGNSFATTESDISSMAMRIAAAGTQVHMSQEDILGLATALASMGVEAEAGGTAISTIMAQIDKDIALNSEAVETWASTAGMSARDFADAWRADPVQALSALLSNMEAATAEGGNMSVMLQELGIDSIRQTDVMKRLAGNSQFVADAVAKANDEWGKNTALQNEVDNRNRSLAAQFEMLKNRVVALAEDVGGPLASALLDIVDQAEPLIKMIADGAKRFSEMSDSEQKAVLQAVALSAALGPMLSLVGKGVKSIEPFGTGLQKVAKMLATVDEKTSMAGRSIKGYTAETKASQAALKRHSAEAKASADAAKKQADAIGRSSVAMGAAKAAAIGLAVAGIALVVAEIVKCVDHQAKLEKATDGLRDSMGSMNGAYLSTRDAAVEASGSADGYAKSLSDVRAEIDKAVEKQAELADSIRESFEEAGKSVGLLDSYKGVIEELAGKSDLSAQKQAELRLAVDGVNDACGTNYEVVKDAGGAYVVMKDGAVEAKDAIIELIDAQEMQIRFDAGKEAYEQSYKAIADNARVAADATAAYNKALEDREENQRLVREGDQRAIETSAEYEAGVRDAERAMNEANAVLSASRDSMSLLKDEQLLLSQAMSEGKGSVSEYVASNDFLLASLQGAGQSCLDFSGTLQGVGASVADLAKLNEEQLSSLASSYDGTYSSIAGLLSEYRVGVDDAKVKTQESFEGMRGSASLYADDVRLALFNAGTDSEELARKLAEAGASTEDFRRLSADQLALLVEAYGGNTDAIKAKLDEFVALNGDAGVIAALRLSEGIDEGAPSAYASFEALVAGFDGDMARAVDIAGSYGIAIPGEIADGMYASAGAVTFAAGSLGEKVVSELTGTDYSETGVAVTQGMAEGMGDGFAAELAAAGLGDDVIAAIMEALDAHSPSRRARAAGETVPAGLAEGIDGSDEPGSAAAALGGAVMEALGLAVEGSFGIGESTGADYADGVGSQDGNAKGQGKAVAAAATAGLKTGDASPGGVLGGAFSRLLGDQAGNARTSARSVAGSASSGLGTGDASSGTRLGSQFASNVGGQGWAARTKGAGVAREARDGLGSVSANGTGTNFVQGFVNGFYGVSIWDAAYRIGRSALSAIESALGIASPSKEAKKLGGFFVEGFAMPLEDGADDLYEAGYDLAMSAYDGMADASGRANAVKMRLEAVGGGAANAAVSAARSSLSPQTVVNVQAPGSLTQADVRKATYAAMRAALSEQPDVVMKVGEKEFARTIRKVMSL